MAKILYGTTWVSDDELAFGLYEMNLQSPDSSGFHRYEIINVMRNDKVVEYRRDMGLARDFKADQIRVPSYLEHTVGELRDIADYVRTRMIFDKTEIVQRRTEQWQQELAKQMN